MDIVKLLRDGTAPDKVKLLAARGLLPLPPREMLESLVSLAGGSEGEIAKEASKTLTNLPQDELLPQVQSRECSLPVLEYFAANGAAACVLEAIVLNPSTSAETVAKLALTVSPAVLETILYNRERLLDFPEILQNIKLNPSLTNEIRRLVKEIETEFFGDKKRVYSLEEAGTETESAPEPLKTPDVLAEPVPEDLELEGLPLDPEAREVAMFDRLARMTVRQKIQHALLGTKEVRSILIRDPNRQVSRNVLRSPKITESEIESFAAMRSVSDEILREIGNSREWTRSYAVVQNLVRNPKTPPTISQRMLYRLQSKDLILVARDRGVPEAVRRNAQRTLSQRTHARSSI